MSIDRVVQPMVACLGNPVAGNPTQYVMTRISREAELDWRFFTSEVDPERFEAAFRGVQALGLAGMAILDPFQELAAGLLDSISQAASLMGRVNVVRRHGDAWIGDNTYGSAIIRLLRERISDRPLREDGTMSPQSIGLWGSAPSARVIEHLIPALEGDFSVFLCNDTLGDEPQARDSSSRIATVTWEELSSLERPVRAFILDAPLELLSAAKFKSLSKRFAEMAWATSPVVLCTQGRRQFDEAGMQWIHHRDGQFIEEIEWMSYRAAADFQFWTGFEPSIEWIRDSLEEYLQW
jgi:shikimate dehydrogenase